MTDLPPALRDWGPELSIFADDLISSIEPWLLRIAAAVGSMRSRPERGAGAPDGLSGLERRGPYGRLLATEWLLADEHPDEFLRRAANFEHLFYGIARQQPAGSSRCVLLFDTGPEQLGAPRIAHLAILLVLAQRARRANATLAWGALHTADRQPMATVTPQSVLTLVRARTGRVARPDDLAVWIDELGGALSERDDLWIVGGPSVQGLPETRGRRVVVQEVMQLDERALDLTITPADHGSSKTLRLQLPEERAAIRLLRDPFEVQTRPAADPVPPTTRPEHLLFSPDGRRLFVRGVGSVFVHGITAGSRRYATRQLPSRGRPIVAVGWIDRQYHLVVETEGRLQVLQYSKRGRWAGERNPIGLSPTNPIVAPGAHAGLSPCLPVGPRESRSLLLCDGLGRALLIRPGADVPARILVEGVTAIGIHRHRATLVVDHSHPLLRDAHNPTIHLEDAGGRPVAQGDLPPRAIITLDEAGRIARIVTVPEGDGDGAAFISRTPQQASQTRAAVRYEPGRWFISGATHHEVEVPPHETAIGLGPGPDHTEAASLITLDRRQGFFRFRLGGGEIKTHRPRATPAFARVSPTMDAVAYLDEDGDLHVEDLVTGQSLRHIARAS